MSDLTPMGRICPKCRAWIPSGGEHECGAPIPSMKPGARRVLACMWQVNTLTNSELPTLTGLQAMNWVARVKMLRAAVEAAVEEMHRITTSSDALRIFVAPEFYFSTAEGHFFDEMTKEQIRASLIDLSKTFPDILIIPGTVAWYKTSQRPLSERKATKHHGQVPPRDFRKYQELLRRPLPEPLTPYDRYPREDLAPHWNNVGDEFGERLARTDPTLKIAHNTIFALFRGSIWHKYNKRHEALGNGQSLDVPEHSDRANIVFPPTDSNPNLPTVDGIRIGLETCVDHEHASLLAYSGTSNHLQVVASGTVSLLKEHAAVRPGTHGGYVLQADAETAGAYTPDNLFPGDFDPYGEDEDNPERAPRQPFTEIKAPQGLLYLSDLRLEIR